VRDVRKGSKRDRASVRPLPPNDRSTPRSGREFNALPSQARKRSPSLLIIKNRIHIPPLIKHAHDLDSRASLRDRKRHTVRRRPSAVRCAHHRAPCRTVAIGQVRNMLGQSHGVACPHSRRNHSSRCMPRYQKGPALLLAPSCARAYRPFACRCRATEITSSMSSS
jgi:hypothetical protein